MYKSIDPMYNRYITIRTYPVQKQQVSEAQEEAIVHGLDCIEIMCVGYPTRDKSSSQGW